jgi:hypothetical protein
MFEFVKGVKVLYAVNSGALLMMVDCLQCSTMRRESVRCEFWQRSDIFKKTGEQCSSKHFLCEVTAYLELV